MFNAIAKGIIRFRWTVIAVWGLIAAVAWVRAPDTPERLDLRGGSEKSTDASLLEELCAEGVAVFRRLTFAEKPAAAVPQGLTFTSTSLSRLPNSCATPAASWALQRAGLARCAVPPRSGP